MAHGVCSPRLLHISRIIPMCCCGIAGPVSVFRSRSMVRATDQLVHVPSGLCTMWKP